MVVEKLDGTPRAGLDVRVKVDKWSHYRAYSKTYTTDSNGRVQFGLPAVAGDVTSFTIRVNSEQQLA